MILKISTKKVTVVTREAGFDWVDSHYSSRQVKSHYDEIKETIGSRLVIEKMTNWDEEKMTWLDDQEKFKKATEGLKISGTFEYRFPESFPAKKAKWETIVDVQIEEVENLDDCYINIHKGIKGWYINGNTLSGYAALMVSKHEKYYKYGFLEPVLNTDREIYNEVPKWLLEIAEEEMQPVMGCNPDERYSLLEWS